MQEKFPPPRAMKKKKKLFTLFTIIVLNNMRALWSLFSHTDTRLKQWIGKIAARHYTDERETNRSNKTAYDL